MMEAISTAFYWAKLRGFSIIRTVVGRCGGAILEVPRMTREPR
jgi:hypothetical protein